MTHIANLGDLECLRCLLVVQAKLLAAVSFQHTMPVMYRSVTMACVGSNKERRLLDTEEVILCVIGAAHQVRTWARLAGRGTLECALTKLVRLDSSRFLEMVNRRVTLHKSLVPLVVRCVTRLVYRLVATLAFKSFEATLSQSNLRNA